RSAQVSAVRGEKMFPGDFAAIGASGGQRKIFEMQSIQILLEFLRRYRSRGQRLLGAALEHRGESLARDFPAASLRLGVQPVQQRRLVVERVRKIHAPTFTAAFWEILNHLPAGLER